jgi:sugar lactone lactonase YvrE
MAIGVDIDRDGTSVWVFDRCGGKTCEGSNIAPIQKFDASGRLVVAFGSGLFSWPHGLFAAPDGTLWVTDGQKQVVMQLTSDGRVLRTLGKPGVAGDGPDTFNSPSDVVVAPNGDIFVADGHGGNSNARVVKFSKDGTFLKTWGRKGTAPGEFDTPHCLAFDSAGRLFVGDRANNRIQIFDQDGKFLDEWTQFSRPSGLYIGKGDILYVSDSESRERDGYGHHPGWKRGIRVGSAKTGVVAAFIPDTFAGPESVATSGSEGIAADPQGAIYGAEVGQKDLKKYVK